MSTVQFASGLSILEAPVSRRLFLCGPDDQSVIFIDPDAEHVLLTVLLGRANARKADAVAVPLSIVQTA